MYMSLGHGHLSPGHDTSQYTLQHTLSPALNCLHGPVEELSRDDLPGWLIGVRRETWVRR
jgi:hypothetical protein